MALTGSAPRGLIEANRSRLHAYIERFVADKSAAEDLAQ